MIAFKIPDDNIEWFFFAYRMHTCCPVMFEIDGAKVEVARANPYNIKAKADCGACAEARREHDWGDV